MEGSEDPGPRAQVAIVLEQLEERVAGGPEEVIGDSLALSRPGAQRAGVNLSGLLAGGRRGCGLLGSYLVGHRYHHRQNPDRE